MNSSILKNTIFLRVYTAIFISSLGDRLTLFILPLWIMESTRSSLKVAIVNAILTIVAVLITPLAGTLADRVSRRKIMIVGNIIGILVMLGFGLLTLMNEFHFGLLLLLIVIRVFGSSISGPASSASLVTFVDKEHINTAVAWRQTMFQLIGVIGPLLAGLLVSIYSYDIIFFLDAISYIISALFLLQLRFPRDIQIKKKKPFWNDLREGFSIVTNEKILRSLLISAGIINILGAGLVVTLQVFVVRMEFNSVWWSIIFISSPIGIIVGSICSKVLKFNKELISNSFVFVGIMGFFNILMGLSLNPILFSIMFFFSGVAFGISNIYFGVLYRKLVPNNKQGRFFGFLNAILMIAAPIGQIIVGIILEFVNVNLSFIVCGGLTVLTAIFSLIVLKDHTNLKSKIEVDI